MASMSMMLDGCGLPTNARPTGITSGGGDAMPEHMMGTTIIAIKFNGGVVIAADSRTSTGPYVANRVSDKLTEISDSIYVCRSGSAADTQAVANIAKARLYHHAIELNQAKPRVSAAAHIIQDLIYSYKDKMVAGIIVAGYDEEEGGQVFSVSVGGFTKATPIALGGSGSAFILGYADKMYKPDMTETECLKFASDLISMAIGRDGSSGGVIRLAVIDANGIRRTVLTGSNIPRYDEPV